MILTVKCVKCKQKIFRYHKVGKGQLLRCWKSRILKDNSVREGDEVKCPCGNLIGIEDDRKVNMKKGAFVC